MSDAQICQLNCLTRGDKIINKFIDGSLCACQIAWIRHCLAYTWFIAIVSELTSCIGFRLIQLTVYIGGANQ